MPPAVALLAISFALGIGLREGLGVGRGPALGLLAATSVALVAMALGRRRPLLGVAALGQALALGMVAAVGAWPRAPEGLLGGAPWVVTGRLVEAPERAFGRTHLSIDLESVARDGARRAVEARARIAVPRDPVEPLLPGDRVSLLVRLRAPRGFVEPDAPDPARRLAERGVVAVGGVAEAAAVARLDEPRVAPSWSARALREIGRWRTFLLGRVAAHLEGERRALVESLVLGERGGLSESLDDAFRVAGVTHVLSVSGLHLAIAALLLFAGARLVLLRITPISRRVSVARVAAALALPATALYTLLTGAAVATVRSCLVAWLFLGGLVLGRPATAGAAFGVAALVLLGASPLALFDPSFQLSFAAAIGTSLLAPPLLRWARSRLLVDGRSASRSPLLAPRPVEEDHRSRAARLASRARRLAPRLALVALGLVITSTAAIAATAPITAWHFAQVAPAGVLANVIVVPLAELWVLPAGLAACALAPLSDGLAGLLLHVAGAGAAAMAAVARGFAAVAPTGRVPAPTLWEAALWYAALAGLLIALRGHARAGARVALVALGLLGVTLGARAAAPRLWPTLTVHFLDVGQGDSCLVELPDGRTLLVDGGGSFDDRFDPGSLVLVPWLRRHGVRRLDVVAVSHPHPDHANGLAAVVDAFPVGEIWTNGADSPLPALVHMAETARARGIPIVRPHAIDGGGDSPARIEVLHPLVGGAVHVVPGWSENDNSIVLRLSYGGRAVLLAGDIERRAERRLVEQSAPGAIAADVLKAPHHGSRTSSTAPLVDAVHPSLVLLSVGADNRWSFPAPEVVARYHAAGARTLRTDEDGAVTVRIDGHGRIAVARARGP